MVQELRTCLSTPGTWVQSLVWEDPTCRRATKPALGQQRSHHNEKPAQRNQRGHHWPQLEKALRNKEDPAQPKISMYIF